MRFEDFKNAVSAAAARRGLTDYELYYATTESTTVSVYRHEINEFGSAVEGGVCFRCLAGGRMGCASTEELSAAGAESVVRRAAENAASLESEEAEFFGEGGKEYAPLPKKGVALPTTAQLVQAALRGQEALYAADPAVVDGSSTEVMVFRSTVAIVNARGLDLKRENAAAMLVSEAVVAQGEEMSTAYEIKAGNPAELDLAAVAGKAVAEAKAKLGAEAAPTGSYPVVFSPRAMASLLETYSVIFSGEAARKGLSKLQNREGEEIAAPCVTLIDDPFYKDSMMPVNFDAEGTPAYTKPVIERGRLNTLLHNLKSAAAAGVETTGNAAKSGYDGAVTIRPFTLYLAAGEMSEQALLQKAQNGVYIDSLGGLHAGANTISGDFSLQSAGFMIENGEKTKAVKSFTVAGNFYQLLKQITALSGTVELKGFGGLTAFAAPAALVEGLSIAGK